MGASGTARTQLALRQSFVFTDTFAVLQPEVLVARAQERFDAGGRLTDERRREAVHALLEALVAWAHRVSGS